jgi:hypothetical protein
MSRERHSRVAAHLLRIGAYVAVVFWLALVYAGWDLVSTPPTGWHPRLVGGIVLILALAAAVAMMSHWVKYLQVVFGGMTLGALLATVSGHLLSGSQPFPRPAAAAILALSIGCGLISRTLARREITTFDRIGILGLLAAVLAGLFEGGPRAGVVGLGAGFICLLAVWVRSRQANPPRRRHASVTRRAPDGRNLGAEDPSGGSGQIGG